MSGIMDFWRGYRSKILAFLINLTALAFAMEYIDGKTAAALTMFFGGTAVYTLREGIKNEVATVMDKVAVVQTQVGQVAPIVANAVTAKVAAEVEAAVKDAERPFPLRTGETPHVLRP